MPDPNDLASQQIADTEGGYDPYKRSLPPVRVLGMTGQQDYPGAIGLPVAGGGAGNALAQRQRITAYHGSPHDFDEFDASKIGTGEGAQSYGHGLYFAQNPAVANEYQRRLSVGRSPDDQTAATYVARAGGDKAKAKELLRGDLRQDLPDKHPLIQAIDRDNSGHHYEVGIDAHPDEFLDWDKPLSEQSGHVQSVFAPKKEVSPLFEQYAEANAAKAQLDPKTSGEELYSLFQKKHGLDREQAAPALHAAGIRGIRYLDQGSRGRPAEEEIAKDVADWEAAPPSPVRDQRLALARQKLADLRAKPGTHNYVIFDPKIVQILKKNGIDVVRGNAAMEGE